MQLRKCWWLLKIEPNAWAGGKGSCAVCIDLQAAGVLEFFGELYSLAKGFGPFLKEGFIEREGSIFSNHQHFTISTGICSPFLFFLSLKWSLINMCMIPPNLLLYSLKSKYP